ncbi:MAG: DUF4173 domain-containing protein [Anaerolineales bacterium]|nr:DUF4173 domain-containing protein [Anaerolineales bacterium]
MKTNPNKLWIIVFALGWLFDYLFWKQAFGVNFAIFAMACLTAAFYLLLSDGLRPNRTSLILLPLFGFFAAVTFIRAEPLTTFLAFTFTLLVMTLLAFTYLGGRWYLYTVADYVAKSLKLFGSMLVRPITFITDFHKQQTEAGIQPAKQNIWPVVRGIVIALPIIAIFASLLASADVIFGQRLEDFIDWFNIDNIPELIFRLVYIVVIGYGLAGVVLHASTESKDEKLANEDKPLVPPFLGYVESTIILGSVVALFAAFVVVQFQYFFGGTTNIHIDGYTYAEYARRGFGELVTVAFFALLMLLTLTAITRRETEIQRRIYSGLGVTLVAFLLVMLVSAYQRLGLYEAVYGFSRLRTYTHVFLIWIGLLLIVTIALEILRKERMFMFAALIASFGFAMSLPILNVDAFIVNQNIQREIFVQSGDTLTRSSDVELDAAYFLDLSDDAVPPLVKAYQSTALSDSVREKIGASLACINYERKLNDSELTWQSFHLARLNADNALASVKNEIKGFIIDDTSWPVMVTTPSQEDFSCSPYYYD